MELSSLRQIVGRIARGTVRPNTILVWYAGPPHSTAAIPGGVSPIRLNGTDPDTIARARAAMRAADDDGEHEVPERLSNGDEFFGWTAADGSILSFAWVCFGRRKIGVQRMCDAPGRAFIYNCHTSPEFRGRGLYTTLLCQVRSTLAAEHVSEFIIDVNKHNLPSRRGIERAGFQRVASLTSVKVLKRWDCVVSRRVYDRAAPSIFAA